jgi:hypothetical protein
VPQALGPLDGLPIALRRPRHPVAGLPATHAAPPATSVGTAPLGPARVAPGLSRSGATSKQAQPNATAKIMAEGRRLASCGGCDRKWDGTRHAHCARCHASFSSPRTFDMHRSDGYCRPAATMRRDNGQPVFSVKQGPYGITYIAYRDPDVPNWYPSRDEEE